MGRRRIVLTVAGLVWMQLLWGQNITEIQADKSYTRTVKLSEIGAKVTVIPLKTYGGDYEYRDIQVGRGYVWMCGVPKDKPFAYELFQIDQAGNLVRKFPVPGYRDFVVDPEREELFIARKNGLYRYSKEGKVADSVVLDEKSHFSSLYWLGERVYYRILRGSVDIRVLSGQLSWLSEEVETPVYKVGSCNRLLKEEEEYASGKIPVPVSCPVFSSHDRHLYVILPENRNVYELKGNRLLPVLKVTLPDDHRENLQAYLSPTDRLMIGDYLFYGYGGPGKAFYVIYHLKNKRLYHCVYIPGERGIEDDIYHTGCIVFQHSNQTDMFCFVGPEGVFPADFRESGAVRGLFLVTL